MNDPRNTPPNSAAVHWYLGLVRHFDPHQGIRILMLILDRDACRVFPLDPNELQTLGPHQAAALTLDSTLKDTPWFQRPYELRVHDPHLAQSLGWLARAHDLKIVHHHPAPLEKARKALERQGTPGIARWLHAQPHEPALRRPQPHARPSTIHP